ncbi:MAG: XRE family transcriptional regulator [Desulfuromonas sp. SDB]|nr:MAG: XRE family transcriptional regulator [Desulfuromonas sp. SDB]
MTVKNKIKLFRAYRGISQEELAKSIGLSRQSINYIEKGKFEPSLHTAFKISCFFNTNIENIFYLDLKK